MQNLWVLLTATIFMQIFYVLVFEDSNTDHKDIMNRRQKELMSEGAYFASCLNMTVCTKSMLYYGETENHMSVLMGTIRNY